jgi:hypothetical protein
LEEPAIERLKREIAAAPAPALPAAAAVSVS